jgi:isoquinoline 1-oxidoreductase subunit beta
MNQMTDLSRRHFLIGTAAVGGGLAIGVIAPQSEALAAFSNPQPWGGPTGAAEFTPWLAITPDDVITVRVAPPEIGNGVMTQMAMTINEELRGDWSKIRAEFADTNRDILEGKVYSTTGGPLAYFSGRSTSDDRMALALQVGASARERLKAAAAGKWGVPAADVSVENGVLTHPATGRTLTYGDVAADAARIKLDSEPKPKPRSEWTTLTKVSYGKLNNPMMVNGSAVFGIDVRLPDMVYAAIRQVPVHGGRLRSVDADRVRNMPGVLAVVTVDPDEPRTPLALRPPFPMGASAAQAAVAVIAEHYWEARQALDVLPVEWDLRDGAQWNSTEKIYAAAIEAIQKPGTVTKSEGDAAGVMDKQPKVIEADYLTGYADHVTMEPLNGTALVTADRVEVWMPTQHSQMGQFVAAEEAGVTPDKVHVHQTFVGGGFGRRVYNDDTRMVVAVAKKFPNRPVHVIWTREESVRQGRYRAMIAAKMKAGLGPDGYPVSYIVRHAGKGQGDRVLADTAYIASKAIPNVQVESHVLPLHILTGPYRGPSYNVNAFIMESFIDELAHAAGIDPLEYRLKLLAKWSDPGWAKALQTVAQRAGWGSPLPRGQGRGIAVANWGGAGRPEHGTTAAAVATVEVSQSGQLKILQLDVTADVGTIANPDAVASQLQGGTIYGLNMALMEELRVENGAIISDNYDKYPMLRMSDVPTNIRVHLDGTSGHPRINEIGEPPVGPVGPAIANAIFQATGKRIRRMPFRSEDLRWS